MKLNLENILEGIRIISQKASNEIYITGISSDSREIKQDFLFVAVKGVNSDGHSHIAKAVENGASVIVVQNSEVYEKLSGISVVLVENSAEALGLISCHFYGNPSKKLKLIGVTGTNGKTTTATLLYKMFMQTGKKAGLISTIKNYVAEKEYETKFTTPQAEQINKLLSQMLQEGCHYCFMEVSSHAIAQYRIAGLEFAGGIFTNITQDHLDYHKDFKEYLNVKKAFFDNLPQNAFALTNIDDKNGNYVLQNTKAKKYSYSLNRLADFKATVIEKHFEGTNLNINEFSVWTLLTGNFNAYNITAIFGTAVLLGVKSEDALRIISSLPSVKGRFETVSGNGIYAIVDYAHTPDALENVLETIAEIQNDENAIITVCGAGGDRDKTKRPIMGKIASRMSNKLIITSDNPRSEKPEDIIEDIFGGIEKNEIHKVLKIQDRKEAIKTAVMLAKKGDIILIAGKGHENYQEIQGVRTKFDDKEIIEEIIKDKV